MSSLGTLHMQTSAELYLSKKNLVGKISKAFMTCISHINASHLSISALECEHSSYITHWTQSIVEFLEWLDNQGIGLHPYMIVKVGSSILFSLTPRVPITGNPIPCKPLGNVSIYVRYNLIPNFPRPYWDTSNIKAFHIAIPLPWESKCNSFLSFWDPLQYKWATNFEIIQCSNLITNQKMPLDLGFMFPMKTIVFE